MNTLVLVIDDEAVTIAPKIFAKDGGVTSPPSQDITFQLHSSFRSGAEDEELGIKLFRFKCSQQGELSFCDLSKLLIEGSGDHHWLIYLDLKFDQAGNTCKLWSERVFDPVNHAVQSNADFAKLLHERLGLALAVHLISLTSWRGLLCIASGTNRAEAEAFMRKYASQSSERQWHALEGSIRSESLDGIVKFTSGLSKFCEIFGFDGLIRWWLAPPGDATVWFPAETALHNSSGGDGLHYEAVARRFGADEGWTSNDGQYSKNLFHITKQMLEAKKASAGPKSVPAKLIQRVLGATVQLDGIQPSDLVCLPCHPSLPFLWAAKHALVLAFRESGEGDGPVLLLKRVGTQFALVLKQRKDATGLEAIVRDGTELRSVSGALHRAVHAKVDCPPGQEYAQRPGAPLLVGFDNPVAQLKWDAIAGELQILWPAEQPK
jgi:hypothetical protein